MQLQISATFTLDYDDTGAGQPIVFLHAFPHSKEMWRPQVAALSGCYRVIVPNMRGWGSTSPFEGEPSTTAMADDVEAMLQALGIDEKIVLCGLSMGGYVALAFAHQYPARLRALVLADTRAEPDTEEGRAKRDEVIAFAQNHSMAEIADKMRPAQLGPTTMNSRPAVVAQWNKIVMAGTPGAVVASSQALRDPHARPWLAEIKVPTLLVFGDEDSLASPEIIATLEQGITSAQLATIEGAGHISNLESPAVWNERLSSFLNSLPTGY